MSTNNFSFENILVVIPDFNFYHESEGCDCEDKDEKGVCKMQGEYVDFDQYGYEEYKNDMQSYLETMKIAKNIYYNNLDKWDNNNGRIIGEFIINDKNENHFTKINVVIRNGYYEGANIDYTIDKDRDYYNYPLSASEMFKLDKQLQVLLKKIEKVLVKYGGEEYLKVGQFSNGEAVYKKK